MSYKNKDDWMVVFPTRSGEATGTSNERKMLDNAGGSDGTVRRVRENPNGTTTLLKTRYGNPTFITDGGGKKYCPVFKPALDHGFLDTSYTFSGINDTDSGKIKFRYDNLGGVYEDSHIEIAGTHAWKQDFYDNLPSNHSGLMRRV